MLQQKSLALNDGEYITPNDAVNDENTFQESVPSNYENLPVK